MNPWISAAVGALAGYAVLALAVLWLLNLCLPVSAHQVKWQCEASFWLLALAYFAASFVATFFARRGEVGIGLAAFTLLFLGHAVVPDLAIVSFGKRWYLNGYTLYFALIGNARRGGSYSRAAENERFSALTALKRARRKAER